ncbi:MAG: hypothetical protein AB7G21_02190 [Dehalococcoidia bacterium]
MQLDEDFRHLLRGFDLDALEEDGSTVVGVWADHRLAYTNAGWERFAAENGGTTVVRDWPLGRSILEAIPDALSPFYAMGVERAARERQPWTHTYECSGPTEYRLLRLALFPLAPDEDAEVEGFLYIHSPLLQEQWDPRPAVSPLVEEYLSEGLVVSCAHCRRFRRLRGALREWVFIPDWLERAPGPVSHGICEPCAAYHFYQRYGIDRAEDAPSQT